MFLTRFQINRTRRETKSMLASPYRLHAAIAGSFPALDASRTTPAARPLWRVDLAPSPSFNAWLYIVSDTEPSLVGLDEQIGFPDRPPQWVTRDYTPLLDRLDAGQTWAFRLTANPVREARADLARYSKRNVAGSRVGHVTVLQQTAWLIGRPAYRPFPEVEVPPWVKDGSQSRAAMNGFAIIDDPTHAGSPQVVVADRQRWRIPHTTSGGEFTLTTARFDGVLRVTDPDRLRRALTHGIGHGKAFGCGLLTLAPVASG